MDEYKEKMNWTPKKVKVSNVERKLRKNERVITLTAFSVDNFCLPTYQKAILRVEGMLWWKKKFLTFSYFPNCDPSYEDLEKTTLEVKGSW